MTENVIQRADAVATMAVDYNAKPAERFDTAWKRLNTVVVEQGDAEFDGCQVGFHLLERCLKGSHKLKSRGDFEHGTTCETTSNPGTMSFLQSHSPLTEECEGFAQIQQIFLDEEVFRDVAQGMRPGDPDKIEPLGFKCIYDPQMEAVSEKILAEARASSPGGQLYADLLAQELALLILRRGLLTPHLPEPQKPLSDTAFAQVVDFMEANLEDIESMAALAKVIDMDVFSFSRGFKAKTGEAPHQYLIGRRIEKAKDLLLHTDQPLAQIAYSSGFASQSHMTHTFSKRIGTPPGAWRRQVRS